MSVGRISARYPLFRRLGVEKNPTGARSWREGCAAMSGHASTFGVNFWSLLALVTVESVHNVEKLRESFCRCIYIKSGSFCGYV